MTMIGKGKVTSVSGPNDRCDYETMATVEPFEQPGEVTPKLVIPWYYRGPTGDIKVGDEVAFVIFADNTGLILDRLDGNWTGKFAGNVELVKRDGTKGNFTARDVDMIEGNLTLKKKGNIKIEKGDVESLEGDLTLKKGDVTLSTGSVAAPAGDVTTKVSLNSHVHPGVQGGLGVTGGPQ